MSEPLLERETSYHIIGAFYDVYNKLGFGFLEHVYMLALERELIGRVRHVAREVTIPILYDNLPLTTQRVDMIVDHNVIVEGKSTHVLPYTAKRQTLNYLRASTVRVAFLLHFGPEAKFYRFVNSPLGILRGMPDPERVISPTTDGTRE